MFTHHAELLHELLEKFPVNVNDCHILMINPEAYHNWLETYSVEGWGSAGTNKRLKYAKEQQQQGAGYRERALDNTTLKSGSAYLLIVLQRRVS